MYRATLDKENFDRVNCEASEKYILEFARSFDKSFVTLIILFRCCKTKKGDEFEFPLHNRIV